MDKKYTLVVVSHTHWDREWHRPFQEFRIRLVRMMDKLLNILDTDPNFKIFVLDGQTVILDDYLEVRRHEQERVARLIGAGRLKVGPWYVLPDEFLVSAEATIRNLLFGHLMAEQFGKPMKAGYVPDPFGHISQMPQILRGFGIEDFYFSRGLGLEKEEMSSEFWWEAPDGSKVLAVNQPLGYCNAHSLGQARNPDGSIFVDIELAVSQIETQKEKLSERCASTVLLLNNGCDHQDAQPEIPEIIRRANEELEDAVVVHGSFEDVGKLIRKQNLKLPTYKGELRAGKYHPLLSGTYSTRMYVKQANARTQTLLEKWAEPFSALAYAHGKPYEAAFLCVAWMVCMQNHPHDSICGCSIDQVHREMMVRFDQSQQIGRVVTRESLAHLASQVDTVFAASETATPAVVFNPLSWDVSEPVTLEMSQKLDHGARPGKYVVRDPEGHTIPSQVSSNERVELHRHGFLWRFDLSFMPGTVPALGYKTFSIDVVPSDDPNGQTTPGGLVAAADTMENDYVRVTVASNGSFDLLDKITGEVFTGLNTFEDTEDAGDEYDYSPARSTRTITSVGAAGTVSLVESGPAFATIRVDTALRLPVGLTPDCLARSSETVDCPLSVFITVRAGSPRVDIVTEFTNNANDHRLRAWFPAGVAASRSQAEGQFDVVERDILTPPGDGWRQKPLPTLPQQSFVNVQQKGRGLTVINQGLPECEVMSPDSATIALTLLRCVAWLSRSDLASRIEGAGPEILTPEAQCPGRHTFRYAAFAHSGDWRKAQVWRWAHQHNVPPRVVLTTVHAGKLSREGSFISVEPDNLVVSALKKAERDNSLILRMYNTTGEEVKGTVRFTFPVKSAALANLNEEPIGEELTISTDSTLSFSAPGFRVVTLKLEV